MKLLLLLLTLLPLSGSTLIKGKGFEGYIFPKEEALYLGSNIPLRIDERFSPSTTEIIEAEKILREKIKDIAGSFFKRNINRKPVIYKKLPNYWRQYAGIINEKGQHIIWINCLWKDDNTKEDCAKQIIQVLDGGSYYWNIKVNLDTGELSELSINGLA